MPRRCTKCREWIYRGRKHTCPPAGPGAATTTQAPGASQHTYYTPSPRFDVMNAEQLSAFIQEKIDWLTEKQRREAEYLAKRARRPGHQPTQTDKDYEADQHQESELLAFLVHFKKVVEDTK